ncbi:MAG: glycosyl hydrolase [Saprospiraceae bacterium]|nr:glycosyl hydrolase [Saprospiraceae bacterium]
MVFKRILVSMMTLLVAHFMSMAQVDSYTKPFKRAEAGERTFMARQSLLANIKAENIGPTIFNGRVSDIEVNPGDPTEFYVAYASGGLWYTHNNGTTFVPLFQQESVMTIGDIAVDWKSGIIYLGSGEQNSSRSSYAGNGVYKSTDKGKTWTHLGLDETHHISKIIIHPSDANIVWVAALGHLYSKNAERGVYKSANGGKTWTQTLFVNNETGASDLIISPIDNDVLYAAAWQRIRSAWHFTASGAGSGIYRSGDGGNTWTSVSGAGSGFVNGEGAGRIGLDISVKDGKEYVYSVIDNNNKRPKQDDKKPKKGLQKEQLKTISKADFLLLKEEMVSAFLEENDFPERYKAKDVINMIKNDKITLKDLATYHDNANTALFDTPVVGAEVYVSQNNGKSWTKTHTGYLDDVYYSYGYYFGQIRVQPNNPDKIYIFGVPILRSDDGGKNWKNIDGENVHSDHHALWLNPIRPGHLINGNDGGVNISYDDGSSWLKCTHPEVGQFYYVNVDDNEPYNVYGGAQDNGVWMGSHLYKNSTRWQSSGDYPYKSILGGDGMQVQIDARDNATIYTGFQFGNYFRINKQKRDRTSITPMHNLGDKPYRWNWQTPILLSPHNQDILYMGANKLLRSMNQGKDFSEISPDLTRGGKDGNVPYGTLTSIDESKLKFGLLYTGSDDGKIHVSKDGGNNWTLISASLPQDLWVSRIHASNSDEGTVYVSLNGYRNDNFKPYVYKSEDYGAKWTDISLGLPQEPVNVVKEDPLDSDILYIGTDHGAYVSLDKGKSYMSIASDMPKTPVHDLVIQKKSRHLILATHGRSFYKVDIRHLPEVKQRSEESLIVFQPTDLRYSSQWGKKRNIFSSAVVPKLVFSAFAKNETDAKVEILNLDGQVLQSTTLPIKKGLAEYEFSLKLDELQLPKYLKSLEKSEWIKDNPLTKAEDGIFYLVPGKYDIRITSGNATSKAEFQIKVP